MRTKLLFCLLTVYFIFNSVDAQFHSPAKCGEDFSLKWSYSHSASNAHSWLAGTLSNTFTNIRISELEYIKTNQDIYLRDNLTSTYFDLTEDMAYGFSSGQGVFSERFEIVFQSEQESLSTADASREKLESGLQFSKVLVGADVV